MHDAVIIGGGAVGCAVARYLSRYRLDICLAERDEDVCGHQQGQLRHLPRRL